MSEITAHSPTLSDAARYLSPGWFTCNVFNPTIAWLTRRGLSIAGSRELHVRGRTSGEIRRTPVNLLELDGSSFLVAPRGNTQWVRNLRAAGSGELRVGNRVRPFVAVELDDAAKLPVLRAYVTRWRWEVGQFFEGLSKNPTDAELSALAPSFPAFVLHL